MKNVNITNYTQELKLIIAQMKENAGVEGNKFNFNYFLENMRDTGYIPYQHKKLIKLARKKVYLFN